MANTLWPNWWTVHIESICDSEGIMGYVLVNIMVLGPNDEPVVHTIATEK